MKLYISKTIFINSKHKFEICELLWVQRSQVGKCWLRLFQESKYFLKNTLNFSERIHENFIQILDTLKGLRNRKSLKSSKLVKVGMFIVACSNL